MEDNQDLRKRARVLFPELMGAPVTEEERISVQARAEEIDKEFGPDYDIRSQLLSSRDPLTGMLRDLKIDDRDLPLAKNYYDWCTGGFIGKLHAPWVRQMIISLIFFGEVCPRCSKKSWLRDITNIPKDLPLEGLVERVQLLEHGVCPSCGANKLELYKSGEMKIFQELVLVWGQRSGKSTSLAMMASYHTHRFLKLPPFGSLTTGMQASTPLTFSFVSLTYGKAVAVLWEPVLSVIDQCTWYKDYFELMDFYGKKYGTELYNKKLQFIRFTYKNLNLIPTHPGWEALRGETRFGAALDELGLFPLPSGDDSDQVEGEDDENGGSNSAMSNDRKMANADEAHTSLNNSLVTVQEASLELLKEGKFHIPTGLMFGVSSPQSHRDKVMRLLRESQTEEGSKTMLGSQLPTWEVNPKLHRDSPRIARLYASNPEKAERDFGANPPRVHSVFIRPQIIVPAFKGPRSTHTLDYDFSVEEKIRGKLKQRTQTEFASVMSIDAGYSNNSFTICSTYFDFKTGKSHTTTVLELIPSQKRKIDFEAMYSEVILPLAKATNTAVLLADQWNSLSTLSRLEKDIEGLVAKQLSPRRKHFDAARQMLVEGSVILPKSEIELDELFSTHVDSYRKHFTGRPVAHLAYQMSTVRDMHPQRPPEKPEVGTDDIFRAWVLGVSVIHQPRVQKLLQEMQERIKKRRNHQGMSAVYVPRGGGGFR